MVARTAGLSAATTSSRGYVRSIAGFTTPDPTSSRSRSTSAGWNGFHQKRTPATCRFCLDADGAVWYADVGNRHCVRVREGGEVLATVALDRGAFACMLGGPDGRTLFMLAAEWRGFEGVEAAIADRTGQVLVTDAPRAARRLAVSSRAITARAGRPSRRCGSSRDQRPGTRWPGPRRPR